MRAPVLKRLFGLYESSWIHLYFPVEVTCAWKKIAPTMKALLFDSGNSKAGPKVYALDVLIQLFKVELLFWILGMIESSRANYRLCLKLTAFSTLDFNFEKLNSFLLLLNRHWEWLLTMRALDVIIWLWKIEFPFLLHGRGEQTCLM